MGEHDSWLRYRRKLRKLGARDPPKSWSAIMVKMYYRMCQRYKVHKSMPKTGRVTWKQVMVHSVTYICRRAPPKSWSAGKLSDYIDFYHKFKRIPLNKKDFAQFQKDGTTLNRSQPSTLKREKRLFGKGKRATGAQPSAPMPDFETVDLGAEEEIQNIAHDEYDITTEQERENNPDVISDEEQTQEEPVAREPMTFKKQRENRQLHMEREAQRLKQQEDEETRILLEAQRIEQDRLLEQGRAIAQKRAEEAAELTRRQLEIIAEAEREKQMFEELKEQAAKQYEEAQKEVARLDAEKKQKEQQFLQPVAEPEAAPEPAPEPAAEPEPAAPPVKELPAKRPIKKQARSVSRGELMMMIAFYEDLPFASTGMKQDKLFELCLNGLETAYPYANADQIAEIFKQRIQDVPGLPPNTTPESVLKSSNEKKKKELKKLADIYIAADYSHKTKTLADAWAWQKPLIRAAAFEASKKEKKKVSNRTTLF